MQVNYLVDHWILMPEVYVVVAEWKRKKQVSAVLDSAI